MFMRSKRKFFCYSNLHFVKQFSTPGVRVVMLFTGQVSIPVIEYKIDESFVRAYWPDITSPVPNSQLILKFRSFWRHTNCG